MSEDAPTYYDVLGVEEDATPSDRTWAILTQKKSSRRYKRRMRPCPRPRQKQPMTRNYGQFETLSAPPPFHPLFVPPLPASAACLELFASRLHEALHTHKTLHPYWRPVNDGSACPESDDGYGDTYGEDKMASGS
ncbi:hypothetical protein IAU59_005882 [Kwoniella sp. CBS 9459]